VSKHFVLGHYNLEDLVELASGLVYLAWGELGAVAVLWMFLLKRDCLEVVQSFDLLSA
jgi:hypothetical protein